MINSIHIDCDECILHSMRPYQDVNQKHSVIDLGDNDIYHCVIHPETKNIIEFARALVGPENVYLLSLGMRHYVLELNRVLGLGFSQQNIRAREDWAKPIRIGYGHQDPLHERWNRNNVLIDNLPYDENPGKCNYLGINNKENYLEVRNFYGITRPDDTFYKDVIDFLSERHSISE